jgi:FixJ family two-component response regulator
MDNVESRKKTILVVDDDVGIQETLVGLLEHRGLRRRFPIIVLSADGRVALKARQIGADDFLPKPFDLDVVLNKVASWTTR